MSNSHINVLVVFDEMGLLVSAVLLQNHGLVLLQNHEPSWLMVLQQQNDHGSAGQQNDHGSAAAEVAELAEPWFCNRTKTMVLQQNQEVRGGVGAEGGSVDKDGVGIGGREVGFQVKGGVGARGGCVDRDGVGIGERGVGFEVKGGVDVGGGSIDKDVVGIGGRGVGFEVKGGVGVGGGCVDRDGVGIGVGIRTRTDSVEKHLG
ncbi:uncharacterized protein G2W53_004102 [Senna tora]|uniref:Uncharacterized protein n=1 Tax=Senna tora TaxID=362788 RepID=A0A834XCL2_9FABA|nr:uncharacterized protein G2W53_004102 [Senna tora]